VCGLTLQKSSKKIAVEYLSALSIGSLDLLAGATATLLLFYVGKVPWILALFPILLTVRGDLVGVFTGVLTSSLHLGSVRPYFRKNTEEFYELVSAVFFLGFSDGVLASILMIIYQSSKSANFLDIIYITFNTFQISSSISIIVTSLIAFSIFRLGLDPDVYVYPIVSILNDVLVGFLIVLSLNILQPWNRTYFLAIGTILFIFFNSIFIYSVYKSFKKRRFKKTVKEAYIAIIIGIFFSSLNGVFLSESTEFITKFPVLLIIYPAFIATLGNQAVIITSQMTTALHIGILEPDYKILYDNYFIKRATINYLVGVLIYTMYSIIGGIVFALEKPIYLIKILATILLTNLILYIFILLPFSVIVSFQTFKRGLDPDNIIISLLTTISDFSGTFLILTVSKILLG